MELKVQIINAFIDGENGGNPSGVGLDADEFSAQQKWKIVGTRIFAPRYGINEESAAVMAAGPLACYLND